MKKRVYVLMSILVLIIAMLALGAQSAQVVNIGLLATISGDLSETGVMGLNAAKLAVEHINAAGGIKALGGAQINLVVGDTTSDYSQSVLVAQRLVDQNKLTGMIGAGVSGMALAVQPVLEKAGIPILTAAVSDALTSSGYKYIFQICPKGSHFGAMQVKFLNYMKETYKLPATKVAIVFENTAYGQSTSKGVHDLVLKSGLNIAAEESYPKNFTDAAPLVTKLRSVGAEVIFPVSYTNDAALILGTMKAMNFSPIVIAGGAGFIWPEFYKTLGKNAEGVFSVGSWSWDTKNMVDTADNMLVVKDWEKKYGSFMPELAGEVYTAMYIMKEALEKAASADPQIIRDTLAGIKITSGRAAMMQPGIVEFDQFGWNKHVVPTIIQWQNGIVKTVFPVEFTYNKVAWPPVK